MSGSSKKKKRNKVETFQESNPEPFHSSASSPPYLLESHNCISPLDESDDFQPRTEHDSRFKVHSLYESEGHQLKVIGNTKTFVKTELVSDEGASLQVDKSKQKKKKKKSKNPDERTLSIAAKPQANNPAPSTFEEELAWCIQQLQLGIATGEKHQRPTYEKNIKTLSSAKTPLPRKRQLMRSIFGDYRSKMKTHPMPDSQLVQSKQQGITSVKTKEAKLESKYFKPSASTSSALASKRATKEPNRTAVSEGDKVVKDIMSKSSVENSAKVGLSEFRFDFEITPQMLS